MRSGRSARPRQSKSSVSRRICGVARELKAMKNPTMPTQPQPVSPSSTPMKEGTSSAYHDFSARFSLRSPWLGHPALRGWSGRPGCAGSESPWKVGLAWLSEDGQPPGAVHAVGLSHPRSRAWGRAGSCGGDGGVRANGGLVMAPVQRFPHPRWIASLMHLGRY